MSEESVASSRLPVAGDLLLVRSNLFETGSRCPRSKTTPATCNRQLVTLVILLCLYLPTIGASGQGTLTKETLRSGDLDREYWVYLPSTYTKEKKYPLVLAFHGGGGTAKGAVNQYHFNPLADKEGFIVVYPNGIDHGWNDGRIAPKKGSTANDLRFVLELMDHLVKTYAVDSHRIFSTGISNGAIFSIYLAYKIPDRILAIAPVCGSMPSNLEAEFNLAVPVSALVINGTLDPLVKYEGGPVVSEQAGRGSVIATEKLIQHWTTFNGCTGGPKEEKIPDDAYDHCTATMKTYSGCSGSSEVALIRVEGGGHTWPGGKQYAPRFMVGEVCRDFDAEVVIWNFFRRQKARE